MAMNQRERVLTIVAAAVIGFVAIYLMYSRIWYGPLKKISQQIDQRQAEVDRMNASLAQKGDLLDRWQAVYRKTIADDPKQAQDELQSRINRLVKAAGLEGSQLRPEAMKEEKSSPYVEAAFVLDKAEGSLAQIVNFLDMLYQEPYLVKVTRIYPLRPTNRQEDRFSLTNCRIAAIVLKKNLAIGTPVVNRLALGEVSLAPSDRYVRIAQVDIFHPPVPERPVLSRPPSTGGTPADQLPKPVKLNPGDGDLLGTTAQGIYLRNSGGATWYNLGEKVRECKLVFVHPLGIILQDADGNYLYVEIGDNVGRAELLAKAEIRLKELYDAWLASGTGGE
jgi:hypothetical protein